MSSAAIICAFNVQAGNHRNVYYDQAKVINTTPVYKYTSAQYVDHRCNRPQAYKNKRSHHRADKVLPTVIGAAIGGTIAKNILKHSDAKHIGIFTGAVIGGAIGNEITSTRNDKYHYQHGSHYDPHATCKVRNKKVKTLDHYQVTYRYRGEVFTTQMNSRPGRKMRVKIKVQPV